MGTNASGNASFSVALPTALGEFISATATVLGNDFVTLRDTSEFSGTVFVPLSANSAPVATNDGYSLFEDQALVIAAPGVLADDSDADSDALQVNGLETQPQHGSVVIQTDGSFTYTPDQNFVGVDSFSYRARDASNAISNIAAVTLTVLAVNDAPSFTAGPDITVFEDSGTVSLSGWASNLSSGPTDESSQALEFHAVAADPSLFAVQPAVAADGTLSFTPADHAHGSSSINIVLQDDGGTDNAGVDYSATSVLLITIIPVNDAPTADKQSVAGDEDAFLPGQVGGSDIEGASLNFELVDGPQYGTLNLDASGSFLYEPNANFNGTDTFTFTATDGQLFSAPATVTVTVNPVNDPPTAVADVYAVPANSMLIVPAATGVLANDFDIDGDSATLTFGGLSINSANGSILFQVDGSFSYAPDAGFVGTETLAYIVSDGQSNSAPGAITIHVFNDPPVAAADAYAMDENTVLSGNILTNDTDANGHTLTAAVVTLPDHGTLSLASDGSFNYVPDANFHGSDSFSYRANDGLADSNVATVTVAVNNSARIQGLVWEDFNNDGEVNFGESAIEGVAIRLTGIDDQGMAVDQTMNTDAHGLYEFTALRPGNYTVTESQPLGSPSTVLFGIVQVSDSASVAIAAAWGISGSRGRKRDSYSTRSQTTRRTTKTAKDANNPVVDHNDAEVIG